MTSNSITYLIGLMIIAVAVLLGLNFFTLYTNPAADARFISPLDVSGIAVEHDKKLYTLNFEQQKKVIAILNQSVKVKKEVMEKGDNTELPYTKIIIYRISNNPIEITPLALSNNQLIFKCTKWNPNGFLLEVGPGNLNDILVTAIKQ